MQGEKVDLTYRDRRFTLISDIWRRLTGDANEMSFVAKIDSYI